MLALSLSAQTVFDTYLSNAQAFSEAFPREKVHLHFDNNSYYQGDTIWFKAYVVDADTRQVSHISKPLYVEFVDQMGNVMERQIVRLADGVGEGMISLANTFFTGYYEVRAYTKWMLAYSDEEYFTRILPVYRKPLTDNDTRRQIAEYRMDDSMKQRPRAKLDVLNVNFYPESGTLVQGVPTVVGFETVSRDSGAVNISGILQDSDGNPLMPVSTIHDGMGTFVYTPGDKPASVVLEYAGKKRTFRLPKAENTGYNVRVNAREDAFDVIVSRSTQTPAVPLALFIFSGSKAHNYVPIDLSSSTSQKFKIMASDLPEGVTRLSLVNEQGATIADRFCFVYPDEQLSLNATTDKAVYKPFEKISLDIMLTDNAGRPVVSTPVSLAVCDAMQSDWRENEMNIYTDLLLTSELKGYIHRPGFYFQNRSASRRKMLDNLLLIRGWRHYDIAKAFGLADITPRYMPEDRLTLYGKVRSYFKGNSDLGVTILAYNDSSQIAGATVTDSIGQFSVPIDDFEGKLEALIQTRKEGKKMNRASSVSLYRRFEPALRPLDVMETNPQWDAPQDTVRLNALLDEADPWRNDDAIVLDELVVKARNHGRGKQQDTEKFERSIVGYYNMRQIIDDMRDEGQIITNDIGNLMHEINKNINYTGTFYKADSIVYSIEGHTISKDYIDGYIDEIETAILYTDQTGIKVKRFNADTFRAEEQSADDFWTGTSADTTDVAKLRDLPCRLDFTMQERFNPNRNYAPTRGVRRTLIQGYNRPEAFYSPVYEQEPNETFADRRRTLYWNPSLITDENGQIHLDCYNSRMATYLTVSAETLVDGHPVALQLNSIATSKGDSELRVE